MEYRQEKKESAHKNLRSVFNTIRKPHVFGISVFDLLLILVVIFALAKLFKWFVLHLYLLFMLIVIVLFVKFDVSARITNYLNNKNYK